MRVLMLSWEYPPRIVGGIARHVEELSWSLAAIPGVEVHVVTCEFHGAPEYEEFNGVHIYRVKAYGENHADFFHWIHELNNAMRDRAALLLDTWLKPKNKRSKTTDPKKLSWEDGIILHPHDWLSHFCAVELKYRYKLPVVATIHATEYGRNSGIHSETNRYINSIEQQLSHEAWRVIVCSEFMKREVNTALYTPLDKMDIIYNGVVKRKFQFAFSGEEAAAFRAKYALPNEKIVMFVGRGVREKGCQVLIEAFPHLRQRYYDSKLVIAGGGDRRHLIDQAARLGVADQTLFTGFIPDDDLLRLYKVADAACFPSLYEPFGIVALEAMAASVPVVVSDAGGLPEVVEAGVTGTVTHADDPISLADGIEAVFKNPAKAQEMAEEASKRVDTIFNWDHLAEQTASVYNRVWQEYQDSSW
jgi:glycogen synthase